MISTQILINFLHENGLDVNKLKLIENDIKKLRNIFKIGVANNDQLEYIKENKITNDLKIDNNIDTAIVYMIITDKYELNSNIVKHISKLAEKNLDIKFGREEKNLIKKILDYGCKEEIENLKNLYPDDFNFIMEIIKLNKVDTTNEAREKFLQDWNTADISKQKDYLYSLYLKLYHLNEMSNIKLIDIYRYNEEIIQKELKESSILKLEALCKKDTQVYDIKTVAKKFYKIYLDLLKNELQDDARNQRLPEYLNVKNYDENFKNNQYILDRNNDLKLFDTEEYDIIYFNINQDIYDRFNDNESFYNYILNYIKECYRVLANNKVFSLKIGNIYDCNRKNLKWDLYSKLSIFAENFIPIEMPGNFYKPEELAAEMLTIKDIILNKEDKKFLKKYYQKKIEFEQLIKNISVGDKLKNKQQYIDNFKYTYFGFTFIDCFILKHNKNFPNIELPEINNTTELLLIFYKYRIDNRKIPCPECSGLKISGNSFPEIGHRSWECKNEICPSRSKSNRGKRFSEKTNYMQWGAEDKSELNIISRELINKWRKDIVQINKENEIYEMLIKYFSFPNEKILFINVKEFADFYGRNITYLNNKFEKDNKDVYVSNIKADEFCNNIYDDYFNNGNIIRNFIIDKKTIISNDLNNYLNKDSNKIKLINGDSFKVLQKIPDNTITSAVTSPPYYNAREYSQWDNLYLYLYDMYNIIKQCYRTIKPGGIFLYNIGDINNNEKIIAKSMMGEKRIPLGAYSILIFQKAGFEIIENIIWDKGETQSNRHKNDGKFTPHYQKPINSYEHMFIFKKPGNKTIINRDNIGKDGVWQDNVVHFSPVIKINSKGENLYGHSAPFPKNIPEFVAKLFNFEGDIMLDPFSGSLTSAIVANDNNLIGLGIEQSKDFVELSVKKANKENKEVDIKIVE